MSRFPLLAGGREAALLAHHDGVLDLAALEPAIERLAAENVRLLRAGKGKAGYDDDW